MKTSLYEIFAGSAAYNLYMAYSDGADRYSYAAGGIIIILILGAVIDYLRKDKVKNAGQ